MATADVEQPTLSNDVDEVKPQPKKNPWGVPVNATPATSFSEVMSEQLASNLQDKEHKILDGTDKTKSSTASAIGASADLTDEELAKMLADETDCTDDLVIAQMLQMQFDKEHDQALGHEESHLNRGSKVRFSLTFRFFLP